MGTTVYRIFSAIVLSAVVVSCAQPSSREKFISAPSPEGLYSFSLDFTDSLAEYDLYLSSRFDAKDSTLERIGDIPLQVTFFSPALDIYTENVFFPLNAPVMNKLLRKDYLYLYRSGMKGYGPWIMTLKVEDGFVLPRGFCGFGVQFVRKNG